MGGPGNSSQACDASTPAGPKCGTLTPTRRGTVRAGRYSFPGLVRQLGVQVESAMRSPILHTKLYAARVRGRTVPRPRLTEHLTNFMTGGRLLLISAPAGFGKTTTLAQWVQTLSADAATGVTTGAGPEPGQDTGSFRPGDPAVAQTTNPPV